MHTSVWDRALGALADSVRLRIACCLLTARDGLCVCEVVDALDEPQPNVSRQLRLLKDAGLVEERREGRWVYHALRRADHPLLKPLAACIDTACCCVDVQQDLQRLRTRLALRRGGKCVVGVRPKKRKGGEARARLPVVR
jgi:ArsR family transcriptional regulator, arsenate/arsenite/antimonite-responsive transcriptional repressor